MTDNKTNLLRSGIEDVLQIGKYTLRKVITRVGDKPPFHDQDSIWIEHESGESMSVPVEQVEALVDKFYGENF